MLKTLLKKQILELCRSFFVDPKKGTARSRNARIATIVGYLVLVVVVLGGSFAAIGILLAKPMSEAGFGWLYFAIVSLIALVMGVVGSVFSTYSSLYAAKDNDSMLSMPIPVPMLFVSRLLGVYLMGLLFTAAGVLPMAAVWWITDGLSLKNLFGGLWLTMLLSLLVLVLSCALGGVVALINARMKRKSLIAMVAAVGVIGAYYVFYFRAMEALRNLAENAVTIGSEIRGSSQIVYRVGLAGTGDWLSLLAMTAVIAVLVLVTYGILSHSFLKLATASASGKKTEKGKLSKKRSPERALLSREFAKYLSSSVYMLNASFGVVILPVGAAAILWKGEILRTLLYQMFGTGTGMVPVLTAAALCMAGSMNLMTVPSVSLEGKNIWIAQSIPVSTEKVLWSKVKLHLWVAMPPMAFCGICAAAILSNTAAEGILIVLHSLANTVFLALVGLALNLKFPLLTWTNETTAVKQGMAVLFAILISWGYPMVLAGLYYLGGKYLGAIGYLAGMTVLLCVGSLLLKNWLSKRGSVIFANL